MDKKGEEVGINPIIIIVSILIFMIIAFIVVRRILTAGGLS